MSLSLAYSPFLLILAVAAAAALTYWTYRQTVPVLSGPKRGVLMGLRFVALALLILLLFEPVLRRLDREAQPPVLAVLIDDSQSLAVSAAAGEDADTAGTQTRAALREVLRQQLPGQPRFYFFSSGTTPAPSSENPLDSLRFTGARTNIAQALDRARDDLQDQNFGGVLLISDGQYNTGRNPLYVADRYPVPIYTVVVGDTARHRDLQIRRITTNELAYLGTELPVQVGLRIEDYPGERVRVTLQEGDRVLDAQTVDLPDTPSGEVTVDLGYEPQQQGLQRLVVRVTDLPGEMTYRNNTASFAVRVLESKKRILLLGAAPGPDVSAAQQLLSQDPNIEIISRVQQSPQAFYGGTLPSDLNQLDGIVLVGYPGQAAQAGDVRRVVQAAADGTPLLFLLTRQTDPASLQQYFSEVLPVAPAQVRSSFVDVVAVPTTAGLQHPILDVPELSADLLSQLPPLAYNESRWQASPDARVLMNVQIQGVPLDDHLFVIRRRTDSRSAALLGAGSWRWQNLPTDLDDATGLWPALLSNTIQWLTTPEDDRRVRVRPIEEAFSGDEPVQFTGQVYNESLNPVTNASVEVNVTAPDGARYPYTMEAVGDGRYVLDAGVLPEGTYSYTAEATRDGVSLGTDRGRFAVGSLTVEFKETRADAGLMRQIAERSGGAFFLPDAARNLADQIESASTFKTGYLERTQETRLWHLYGLLAIVLALLAVEWFVRKRSGMV